MNINESSIVNKKYFRSVFNKKCWIGYGRKKASENDKKIKKKDYYY